ncbi:hypothetical protein [Comamonas sp. NLF-1-9]|uniref:hypothetical protein n=1 Tax=Comamonas sp. NLF-1-9 TaxID=2853163 RepID=UPI001C460BCB|nr:hypothetical protein [Comamonas sp. NLF-1-9]QXL84106.1 hypothetical protein KUD94_12830 [Comamonas sp. NLF-1-9]
MNTQQLRTCDEAGLCIQRPGPGCTCQMARALLPLMEQARDFTRLARAHAQGPASLPPPLEDGPALLPPPLGEGRGGGQHTPTLPHARQLWAVPEVPRATQLHNMRAWRRAVRQLGPRWLLATPVARLPQEPRA